MSRSRARLLFSARDVGAGQAIVQLAAAARRDGRFDVTCALQSPAAERFGAEAGAFRHVDAPVVDGGSDAQLPQLLELADDILADVAPDALVVGLSGPGAGLDEALLHRARRDLPTFAVQDFWGDVNLRLGTLPGCFFVVDDVAARLTSARCGVEVKVAGSIKHASLAAVDTDALRRDSRAEWRLGDDEILVAFIGQPLWHAPGYGVALRQIFNAVKGVIPKARVAYRPHPKESPADGERALAAGRECGATVTLDRAPRVEPLLCAGNIVVSAFSTAGYDHAFLNRRARAPLGVVLHVLTDPGLHELYREMSSLDSLPLVELGLALLASKPSDLGAKLRSALEPATREKFWRAAKEKIAAPETAPRHALDVIAARLSHEARA